ncbi:phage tail-collar fiber domain-containing protein [Musicola paradisiaca]|uniref:Tail Collar domain protein n=1 Tax=Musicola paradisiaca (strain Ech703) TaxID=579405 RepID=C6C5D2_MUSP7|nr:phage tail protein [Musicola paradisiaca]ACS87569.1 Tail Collar domain protein [Musicola paradisiaca Ech703]
MTTKYIALLTQVGENKLANATALGKQLEIARMGVGDGGGSLPTPSTTQTTLINEKRRAALNSLSVDSANPNQIIAEQVIPEDEGGWWIREIGLYDNDGNLIAVANCPETYKPLLQEGSGRVQTVRMILIVSSTDAVTLKIDPSVVLATRKYVDDSAVVVKAYADDAMAKHLADANPHKQYALLASPALTGTPTAPTAAAGANTTQLATTAFVSTATANHVAAANPHSQYALLASPALTGTPTAPTAAAGANTTQLATTAFVSTATANHVAAANPHPQYAPLASPALTGTPTAPTAAAGANTTQLATTAFVSTATANLSASTASGLAQKMNIADVVGIPLPWPQATAPTGWLKCNGQSFDKALYPKLATVYPSGVLPDLRGEFIRGWDDGRGVDAGRAILTAQNPTYLRTGMMDYNGSDVDNIGVYIGMGYAEADTAAKSISAPAGAFRAPNNIDLTEQASRDNGVNGTASNTVYASEGSVWVSTRPRNIAFNYIVRAA